MRLHWLVLTFGLAATVSRLCAQDLAPRAYVITPKKSNALTLTWSYFNGGLNFNGAVPIKDATGIYNVEAATLYHSFSFFGRSANALASLPYAEGNFTGEVSSQDRSIYRSGLVDFNARLSVNLYGGRAMDVNEFLKWKQKKILGASIRVIAPTGQYDPSKLINWGINRWAFKPELGYSQRLGNFILDGYGGVWFYTTNPAYFNIPVPEPQTVSPVTSLEGHLSYDFPRWGMLKRLRGWASLDGNFWAGGIGAVNSIRNLATKQTASRIGATISIPYSKHQSVKISYSNGAYVRFGGDYQNVSVAWQYSWIGKKIR